MSLEPEFLQLMSQQIIVYRTTTDEANEYGEYLHETVPVRIQAHIVGRVKQMVGRMGDEVLSTGWAAIPVTAWLTADAECWVPEPSSTSGKHPGYREVDIIGVQTRYDETGEHHQQVYYGEKGSG